VSANTERKTVFGERFEKVKIPGPENSKLLFEEVFLEVLAAHGNVAVIAADLDLQTFRYGLAVLIQADHHRCLGTAVADRLDLLEVI
jgi:hypothetical protein